MTEKTKVPGKYEEMGKELEAKLAARVGVPIEVAISSNSYEMLKATFYASNPQFPKHLWKFATISHHVNGPSSDSYEVAVWRYNVAATRKPSNPIEIIQRRKSNKAFNDVSNIFKEVLRKEGRPVIVSEHHFDPDWESDRSVRD